MSYKVSDIMYEKGNFWVLQTNKGYEVYEVGVTCSTRCAIIGYKGAKGLERAIAECDKRVNKN